MPILAPLFVRAPAKINLTLDVLGKRADGYHELASVMQTIALADTIALWPAPSDVVTLDCNLPELCGPDNLALRAAHAIRVATGERRGVHIELAKQIPMQGGLGGGSSDAATVLLALNAWWNLGLSAPQLIDLAAHLGSDVPFFIVGGTALITGRGEVVTQLPDLVPLWLVVAKPPVGVSTPAVFRTLTPDHYSPGTATTHLIAHIRQGSTIPLDAETLHNALEAGVLRDYPPVADTRAALLAAGAPCVRMSGSGPTLYAPFTTLREAATVHAAAQRAGVQVWLTHTIPADHLCAAN